MIVELSGGGARLPAALAHPSLRAPSARAVSLSLLHSTPGLILQTPNPHTRSGEGKAEVEGKGEGHGEGDGYNVNFRVILLR